MSYEYHLPYDRIGYLRLVLCLYYQMMGNINDEEIPKLEEITIKNIDFINSVMFQMLCDCMEWNYEVEKEKSLNRIIELYNKFEPLSRTRLLSRKRKRPYW